MIQRNKQTDVGKREFPVRKQDACGITKSSLFTHTHITLDSSTDTNTNSQMH